MKKLFSIATALVTLFLLSTASAAVSRNGTISELTPLMYQTGMVLLPTTTVSDATYTLSDGDVIIDVTRTSTGTCTLTIPASSVKPGKYFVIKDAGRGSATYNITIATAGTDTIDGANTYTVSTNGQSLMLYSDGTNWSVSLGYLGPLTTASGGSITFGSRSVLSSPADDKFKVCNAAATSCWIADLTGDGLLSLFAADGTTPATVTVGAITVANVTLGASNTIIWTGRSIVSSTADDKVKITNAAATTGTVIDHTGDGAVSVFAKDGTTAATWTFGHVVAPTAAITTVTGALSGNASTATALAANGSNCDAGSYPLGVSAAGAVESCAAVNLTDGFVPADGVLNVTGSVTSTVSLTTSHVAATTAAITTVTGALTGNASTASALAADGANCSAGAYPLGVDAAGAAQSCAALNISADYLLGSIATFNVSGVAEHVVYTVPAGKTAVITKIVIRSCAGTLDQATDAVVQWGCNAGVHNDVLGAKTLTAPTASTTYQTLVPTAENSTGNVESTMCAAESEFTASVTTSATTSTLCTMDVWGYVF